MGYTSLLIERIESYLIELENDFRSKTIIIETQSSRENVVEQIVLKAASELGYGTPFDKEQSMMNALLIQYEASEITARTIWSFYHDFKMAEAIRADAA